MGMTKSETYIFFVIKISFPMTMPDTNTLNYQTSE